MNITIRISSSKNNFRCVRDLIMSYSEVYRELKKEHLNVTINIEVEED